MDWNGITDTHNRKAPICFVIPWINSKNTCRLQRGKPINQHGSQDIRNYRTVRLWYLPNFKMSSIVIPFSYVCLVFQGLKRLPCKFVRAFLCSSVWDTRLGCLPLFDLCDSNNGNMNILVLPWNVFLCVPFVTSLLGVDVLLNTMFTNASVNVYFSWG